MPGEPGPTKSFPDFWLPEKPKKKLAICVCKSSVPVAQWKRVGLRNREFESHQGCFFFRVGNFFLVCNFFLGCNFFFPLLFKEKKRNKKSLHWGSNPGPHHYKWCALPLSHRGLLCRLYGSVAEHRPSKSGVLGSIPSGGFFWLRKIKFKAAAKKI